MESFLSLSEPIKAIITLTRENSPRRDLLIELKRQRGKNVELIHTI